MMKKSFWKPRKIVGGLLGPGLAGIAVVLVAGTVSVQVPGAAAAEEALRLEARIAERFTPLTHNSTGRNMPAFITYAINTRMAGEDRVYQPDQRLVSNPVSVPRSDLGGPGSEEWSPAIGVIVGGLSPYPVDAVADSFYAWTGLEAGAQVAGGDDISQVRFWGSGWRPYEVPHQPTGRQGTLTWTTHPEWSTATSGTWTYRQGVLLPDGTSVLAPPAQFTRSIYVSHADLESSGGDVDASGGDVVSPTHDFAVATPPGTTMDVQFVSYTIAGPWAGKLASDIDWDTGQTSGATGTWRLPIGFTLRQGGFLPERVDSPVAASPQYVIPVDAVAVPTAPESAGPGANETHLVANVQPGQHIVTLMALRRPDGSLNEVRLDLDEPGTYQWRVEGGRLIEEAAPSDSAPLLSAGGAAELGDGMSAGAGDEPAGEGDPADSVSLHLNEEGRVVATGIVRDGARLLDGFDLRRLITPEGPVELDASNRVGEPIIWEAHDGDEARAYTAHRVGGVLLLATFVVQGSWFRVYVRSMSADGAPHPHTLEAVSDIADDATLVDRLVGPAQRTARLLPSEVDPRLVVRTPAQEFPVGPLPEAGGEVILRNAGELPRGEPLTDPQVVSRLVGPAVWDAVPRWPIWMVPTAVTAEPAGELTAMRVYRLPPTFVVGQQQVSTGVPTETRDVDGTEGFAIAFTAERADGTPILRTDVDRLSMNITTLDGRRLYAGNVIPEFTPDGGTTWGVALTPLRELEPAEVIVYARATLKGGGLLGKEHSPSVPPGDWRFSIDRAPVRVTSATATEIRGTTEPLATVEASIPELGIEASATASSDGAFTIPIGLAGSPGGEYEVVVRATTVVPSEPERTVAANVRVPAGGDSIPDDEVGTTIARLRYVPGGSDPAQHRTGPVDVDTAAAFLLTREQDGAFDGHLRPTAWSAAGLDGAGEEIPAQTSTYISSLQGGNGFAWRPGEAPSAAATGLAAMASATLGLDVELDPAAFLRWDGSADAAAGADISSLESTALLVLALDASGELGALDPWWAEKVRSFLVRTQPIGTADAFARAAALAALGEQHEPPSGDDLDGVAYRLMLGGGGDLAPYQTVGGGFSLAVDGDTPEALPTALALAALRKGGA